MRVFVSLCIGVLIGLLFGRLIFAIPADVSGAESECRERSRTVERLERELALARSEPREEAPLCGSQMSGPAEEFEVQSLSTGELRPSLDAENLSGEAKRFSNARLSVIERHVALTDDERRRLREKLEADFLASKTGGSSLPGEDVEGIIGAEKYQEFKNERLKFLERVREERLEGLTLKLSRRLGLDSDSEAALGSVLREAEEGFGGNSEERDIASEFKVKTPSEEEALVIDYLRSEMKKREYIRKRLKPLLTEEQFNTLIEYQENSPEALAHSQYLATATEGEGEGDATGGGEGGAR